MWQVPLPGKSQQHLTGNGRGPPEPKLALDFQAHFIPTKIFPSFSTSILSQRFYECTNATDPEKNSKKMQHTNKVVPSGYAARLLLMVVGTGVGREESRMDLGSVWSSVLHFHPGFLSLQGDAPQAGATSLLGGSSPLVVSILELGVLSKQAPLAASGWRWTHRSCLRLT